MASTDAGLPQQTRFTWSSLRRVPPLIWIPLFAVLLTTLAVSALSEWSARRAHASGERVAEVLHRLDALSDLKSLILDIEAGQRGYLLTRDPIYLAPFVHAERNLPAAQSLLADLMRDEPDAQATLNRIHDAVERRVAHAREAIELANSGMMSDALEAARVREGRELMESLRAQIDTIESRAQGELARLQQEQAVSTVRSRIGLLVMTVVSLGLLIMVARLFILEAVRQENRRTAVEREARDLEKLVEARTRELSALSTHLQEFAEKEKSELARNLHDELGGLLTAAKMDLSWLQSRLDGAPIQERLAQLGSVLDEAMDLKRRVVDDLRPSLLDHFGLPTALRAYLESACAKAGLECELDVSEDGESIPKDVAIALFRVVQEGMTNIVRHAQARRVKLVLASSPTAYTMRLSDDGVGFDPQGQVAPGSHGLTGMRHRVKALGGRFAIESRPRNGTTVHVEVPVRAAAEKEKVSA